MLDRAVRIDQVGGLCGSRSVAGSLRSAAAPRGPTPAARARAAPCSRVACWAGVFDSKELTDCIRRSSQTVFEGAHKLYSKELTSCIRRSSLTVFEGAHKLYSKELTNSL